MQISISPLIFADLDAQYASAAADDLYIEFIRRYGIDWARSLTTYVSAEDIKRNRSSFYDFYFDPMIPLSERSDPRSGMFVRNSKAIGGKIELLMYLALGLEGFAQTLKIPRHIDGVSATVKLGETLVPIDIQNFDADFNVVQKMLKDDSSIWDDELLRPSYEDALSMARSALVNAAKAKSWDNDKLFTLTNIVLCGAHCQRCPTVVGEIPNAIAVKMNDIMIVGGAIRGATNEFVASLK